MLDRKKWSGGRARKSNQPPRELNGRATDNLSGVFGRCMEHQDVLGGFGARIEAGGPTAGIWPSSSTKSEAGILVGCIRLNVGTDNKVAV